MATYVPNASDPTQPTEDKTVESAALEFRTIKGVLADVTAVAGGLAAVMTVADDLNEPVSEIETVATNIANVNTVGANIANVNNVASNTANITTVANDADAINTVAGINTQVATVAANVTDVTNFADVYLGPKAANPATRNDATALQAGDLYFNTVSATLLVYTGTIWDAGVVGVSDVVDTSTNQTIGGTKTFSNPINGTATRVSQAATFGGAGAAAAPDSAYDGGLPINVTYTTLGATAFGWTVASATTAAAARTVLGTDIYKTVPINGSGFVSGECYDSNAVGLTLNTGVALGSVYTLYNHAASAMTITQGVGLTLRLAGTTSTGNRNIAAYGMASIIYISSTEAIISGAGVS